MTKTLEIHNFEEALASLGVTPATLSRAEKTGLDQQGYTILANVIDKSWLARLRNEFERLTLVEKEESAGAKREKGTRHLSDLAQRGELFQPVYSHPRLLAAVQHVLGRQFRLLSLGGRDPKPGFGQQSLHADWMQLGWNDPYQAVTALWMLDDFTAQNGATRVLPGTHLLRNTSPKLLADPAAPHPQEVIIEAPAGSVLVFNSHLWHSGRLNRSNGSRRSLQCMFVAGEIRQYQPQTEGGAAVTGEPLSPALRYILGQI